jgi:rod shape-determining protein MreD
MIFILILMVGALLDGGNLLNIIAMGSGHVRPSILIVAVVFSAFHTHRQDAIRCAFTIGFFADLVSAAMGPHMIIYGLLGASLNGTSRIMNMRRVIHQGFIVFFAFLATEFPIAWLESWKTGQSRPHLFSAIAGTALYTAVFAPAIWMLLSSVWKRIYPRLDGRQSFR